MATAARAARTLLRAHVVFKVRRDDVLRAHVAGLRPNVDGRAEFLRDVTVR